MFQTTSNITPTWVKMIPFLRIENLKHHTLCRGTYLYSPHMGVLPHPLRNITNHSVISNFVMFSSIYFETLICSFLNSMDLKPTTVLRPYQVFHIVFAHSLDCSQPSIFSCFYSIFDLTGQGVKTMDRENLCCLFG